MIIDIKKDTKKDKKTLKQVVEFSTARYNRKDEVSAIELKNLRIDFGETLAVDNVSFKIKQGEMVTLLGPSGCGKTTTLNAIAGLIQPTAGRIKFQGVDVTKTSPQKRKLGLVFQNYALYPHMSVYKNIAFPLQNDSTWKFKSKRKNTNFQNEVDQIIFKTNGASKGELEALSEALYKYYRTYDETKFFLNRTKSKLYSNANDAKASLNLIPIKERSEISILSNATLELIEEMKINEKSISNTIKSEAKRLGSKENRIVIGLKQTLVELKIKNKESKKKLEEDYKIKVSDIKLKFKNELSLAKEVYTRAKADEKESEWNEKLAEAKSNISTLPRMAKNEYATLRKELVEKYTDDKAKLSQKDLVNVNEISNKIVSIRELIHREVMDVAKRVDIVKNLQKKPTKLSGGQQQRVAIARAIVKKPKVLLMDEPLSNLDAKLRLSTREWIRGVQQELGITTVFVTHDQEEAMSISDTVIIMSDGEVQQIGSPMELYKKPANAFVAKFLGVPEMKMFKGKVAANGDIKIEGKKVAKISDKSKNVLVGVRSNQFIESKTGFLKGTIASVEYLGREVLGHFEFDKYGKVDIVLTNKENYEVGEVVKFNLKNDLHVFDGKTEKRVS